MSKKIEPEIQITTGIGGESGNRSLSGHKITRFLNGKPFEIELTEDELREAYSFKERKYYTDYVKLTLEKLATGNSLTGYTAEEIIADEPLMAVIVSAYAKNKDRYGMDCHESAIAAIRETLNEWDEE